MVIISPLLVINAKRQREKESMGPSIQSERRVVLTP